MGWFGAVGGVRPERRRGLWVSAWPVASWLPALSGLPHLPETPFIHLLNHDIGQHLKIKGQALLAVRCFGLLA